MNVKYIPVIIAAVLVVIGIFIFSIDVGLGANFILLAILIGIVPFVFLSYFEYQRIKSIEDQIPIFLLDLSEAQKVGLNLSEALKNASKTDYGKLTPEIKRISDQLSWGVPIKDAMENFAKRLKKSKLITRIIRIVNEAYASGGDIARTMEATASDITLIKEAEKERKAVTSQHVMVMYAIFFLFIGIVIGLSKTLIPLMEMSVETAGFGGVLTFQDPCIMCVDNPHIACVNCAIFSIMCQMFNIPAGGKCYYNGLFLLMAVVQGIFAGLVAGQIGEGSVIAGFKHSVIMTLSGFGILVSLIFTGMI
jgi:flagellar protein FlaJ